MNSKTGNKDFLSWLSSSANESKKQDYLRSYKTFKKETLILGGLEVSNLTINQKLFDLIEFRNCTFEKCEFTYCTFNTCTFIDCLFIDCNLNSCKILDSELNKTEFTKSFIYDLEIADVSLKLVSFKSCSEIYDLRIRDTPHERIVNFNNCYLHYLDIEPHTPSFIDNYCNDQFLFLDCLVHESSFDRLDLTKSKFTNCDISLNQFSACKLNIETLIDNNNVPGDEYNLVDMRTITNSPKLPLKILEQIFGIFHHEAKEYLAELMNEIQYQSIFISYSFHDSEFAKAINEALLNRGIITFLWEKDSPGGKPLKSIMSEGIRNKDRILFISSRHSLKSDACHHELTEGRKKQEKIWEDVLFPIHIDNYLFELKKDSIRPVENQENYWRNITELKLLNSLDFSRFVTDKNRRGEDFEKLLMRLIKGLRKTK